MAPWNIVGSLLLLTKICSVISVGCVDATCDIDGKALLQVAVKSGYVSSMPVAEEPMHAKNNGSDCGFFADCPRNYNVADINALAAEEVPENSPWSLQELHAVARSSCLRGDSDTVLASGAWCYSDENATVIPQGNLADVEYLLPRFHVQADPVLLDVVATMLLRDDGSCCYSLSDLGSGVGQFGHALRARLPDVEYQGYDAAGNVEEFTHNYVNFADLSVPLKSKRTDWVISSEVGEHIPHEREKFLIANIHAHNCRGVVLTWAVLRQIGHGHINCHSNDYLITTFEGLGYALNRTLTEAVRVSRAGLSPRSPWLEYSSMVFDRLEKPMECRP